MGKEGASEIGHLIAGDVGNKLEFKIFSNSNISVGDFVLLKDKYLDEENNFVGRITNIKLQTLGRSDYLTEMSTQIEVSPMEVDPYEFRDSRSEILTRIAESSLIGILKNNKILPPKKIPNHLSPVLIPKVDEMEWITISGDVEVGNLRAEMRGDGTIPIKLNSEIMVKKHLFVAAMTGSGKTVTVKTIIAGLFKTEKYGILIFDVHGEYAYSNMQGGIIKTRGLRDLSHEDVVVYGLDNKADKKLMINYRDLNLSDLYNFYDWSGPQREALEIIFGDESHKESGIHPLDYIVQSTAKTICDDYYIHEGPPNVIIRRVKQILKGGFDFVSQDDCLNLYEAILGDLSKKKIVIIDFTQLSEKSENIIINILSRRVLNNNKWKTQRNQNPTNIFIVLEEAQRFLDPAEYQNKGVMRELVREGRKFGVGLGAVTQIPRFFDERILSQFNTYIILKLSNSSDRNILEGGSPQNISDMFTEIATLYPGEAVIVGEAIPLALPVKIHLFDKLDLSKFKRKSVDDSVVSEDIGGS
jgi:DNA helicase HerA-like ATPase